MSDIVEAYQKWLGIPPEDLPPDHYRLLGIELFESHRPTIDTAAKRLMGMLQKQLAGPDQASIRKLLDEISDARRSLLLSDRKTAYDQKLRAALEARREAESSQADESTEPDGAPVAEPIDSDPVGPRDVQTSDEIAAVEPIPDAAVPEAEPLPLEDVEAAPEPELIDESQEPPTASPIDEPDDAPDAEPFDEIEEPTALEQVGEPQSAVPPDPRIAEPKILEPATVVLQPAAALAASPLKPAAIQTLSQPKPAAAQTAATRSAATAPAAPSKPAPKQSQPIAAAARPNLPVAPLEKPVEKPVEAVASNDAHRWDDPESAAGGEIDGSFFSGMGLSSVRGAALQTSVAAGSASGPAAGGKAAPKAAGNAKNAKSAAKKSNAKSPAGAKSAAAETQNEGTSTVKNTPKRGPEMWQIMVGVGGGVLVLILVVAAMTSGPATSTSTTARPAAVAKDPPRQFGPHTVVGPIDDRTVLSPIAGNSAVVPVERHGDLMLVDVKINDQEAGKFLLDTGTRDLIISKEVADKLNLPARHSKNMKMPGGVQEVTERKIDSLAMGPVRFEQKMILPPPRNDEWLTIAADIGPWAKAIDLPIVGVIGGEVWSQVPFSIDPKHNVITFYKRGPFPFSAGLNPEFLTKFDNFLKPAISATVDQGTEGTFLVATGVPTELMVKGSTVQVTTLHAFGQDISQPATIESKEGDGYFDADDIRQSGVIGAGILSHYLLMFDYANEKFLAVPIKK